MSTRSTSSDGISFIKRHEGYSATPYKDSGGKLTIGYGHLILNGEVFGAVSNAQATSLLTQDVGWAENIVNKHVTTGINQQQFDACVDFTYNLGAAAFINSTLITLINTLPMDLDAISAQFNRWIHCNGQVLNGLITRRQDEATLFTTGQYGN